MKSHQFRLGNAPLWIFENILYISNWQYYTWIFISCHIYFCLEINDEDWKEILLAVLNVPLRVLLVVWVWKFALNMVSLFLQMSFYLPVGFHWYSFHWKMSTNTISQESGSASHCPSRASHCPSRRLKTKKVLKKKSLLMKTWTKMHF